MTEELALALPCEETEPLFTELFLSNVPHGHTGELQLLPDASEVAAKRQKRKDDANARADRGMQEGHIGVCRRLHRRD